MEQELTPPIVKNVAGAKGVQVYGFSDGSLEVNFHIIMDENATANVSVSDIKNGVQQAVTTGNFTSITADPTFNFTVKGLCY